MSERATGRASAAYVVHLPAGALAALADGDLPGAEALSPVPLSAWLVEPVNLGVWRWRATQVVETPADLGWVTGVIWDPTGGASGATVGRGGFHAAPDSDGMVELGYAVDPAHRRQGHARAVLEQAIARTRADPDVRVLRLTIAPDNEGSLVLARQHPFVDNGEQWDDEDGLELILELDVT